MLVKLGLLFVLTTMPLATSHAQSARARRAAACRCQPGGKPRRPRFLLPVAGIGFLPVSLAARDSQVPDLTPPTLVDIRDANVPRNALEGERELEVGALAPDTATILPTLMLTALIAMSVGVYFMVPRRRRRAWAVLRRRREHRHGAWKLRTAYRRRLGGVFAGTGALMLLLGAREYAEGAQAQRRARDEWARELAAVPTRGSDAATTAGTTSTEPEADGPTHPSSGRHGASAVPLPDFSGPEALRRGMPVARLVIPAIHLDEIVIEGVGPAELNAGPGHFPGSVLPGDQGNAIISAHRDRHFRRFGELGVGSRIRTETLFGSVEWVVTERRVVSRDTPALFKAPEATLTLTTCWPIRYFGSAPDRLLLVARPISAAP